MPASIARLTEEQIAEELKRFPDWAETSGSIHRTFQFRDFLESVKFVNAVAVDAEADQHHPDILVRWNKVTLTLSTHDAGGISAKDFALAGKVDALAKRFAPAPPPPPIVQKITGGTRKAKK